MSELRNIRKELKYKARPEKKKILQGFFKTGKGEYAEGDIFLGVIVPDTRKIAKKYSHLSRGDLRKLLSSKIHEERLSALFILEQKFLSSSGKERENIYQFYLTNSKYINNWDLVDTSAPHIIGTYLLDKPREILYTLAVSKNLWQRRIAIISTFAFIRAHQYEDTLALAEILLFDQHDLIHKAVGWMLREVGKRSLEDEEVFLKKFYKKMPRTMLRYAIEKFPETQRKAYLHTSRRL